MSPPLQIACIVGIGFIGLVRPKICIRGSYPTGVPLAPFNLFRRHVVVVVRLAVFPVEYDNTHVVHEVQFLILLLHVLLDLCEL